MYAGVHFLPFFGSTLAGITEASIADYVRARLRRVKAITVRKELSALRGFARWAYERGHLPEPVEVRGIGRRVLGTATPTAPRRVDLTPEEVERILAELPETTRAALRAVCSPPPSLNAQRLGSTRESGKGRDPHTPKGADLFGIREMVDLP